MINPFTIIRTDGKFTVRMVEGTIVRDVECENEDDARALANVRPFYRAFEAEQVVDLQELQKSIDAVERYGLTGFLRKGYHNLLYLKEDIQSGKIK